MIKFTKEGEIPINGINFYPINDRNQRGFRIRIGRYVTYFRYSIKLKKFRIWTIKSVSDEEYERFMNQ